MAKKFRFKNHKKSGITVTKKDVEQGMDAKQIEEYAKILAPTAFKYGSNWLKTASPAFRNALLTEHKKIDSNS
mgnify:CR=1 FL=1